MFLCVRCLLWLWCLANRRRSVRIIVCHACTTRMYRAAIAIYGKQSPASLHTALAFHCVLLMLLTPSPFFLLPCRGLPMGRLQSRTSLYHLQVLFRLPCLTPVEATRPFGPRQLQWGSGVRCMSTCCPLRSSAVHAAELSCIGPSSKRSLGARHASICPLGRLHTWEVGGMRCVMGRPHIEAQFVVVSRLLPRITCQGEAAHFGIRRGGNTCILRISIVDIAKCS